MDTWEIVRGYANSWTVTIRDANDNPITPYLGSEGLSAFVYPGRGFASILSPTCAWVAPVSPATTTGVFTVSISAAQSATLSPGLYFVQAGISFNSAIFFNGALQVDYAPGTDVVPPVYCQLEDMLNYAPWITKLQTEEMSAGFVVERGLARQWLDDMIVRRFRWDLVSYQIGQTGFMPMSLFPAYQNTPPSLWMREQLTANYLVLRSDVVRCVAYRSLGILLGSQLSRLEDVEQRMGWRFNWEAEQIAKTLRCEITLNVAAPNNLDTWPSVTIDLGSASLRG